MGPLTDSFSPDGGDLLWWWGGREEERRGGIYIPTPPLAVRHGRRGNSLGLWNCRGVGVEEHHIAESDFGLAFQDPRYPRHFLRQTAPFRRSLGRAEGIAHLRCTF